jgi:hypothetical protein
MRKALCVGIDYYDHINNLFGCVADACSVKEALCRNGDGTVNFNVHLATATSCANIISRKELKSQIEELFAGANSVALFYFAGHGCIESTGGYLLTSECKDGDDGLPLADLLKIASDSKASNKIIILDSCHSGAAGSMTQFEEFSMIKEGMTILTACDSKQYASEENGHGVFTTLLVDALYGGAMNLLGEVTPGSVYAHIDQALGPWQQRPIFKTNIKNFISLRKNVPPIPLSELHQLTVLFPNYGDEFSLDPSFEPESDNPVDENCKIFRILQNFNRVNLVVPVGAEHMYFAAMENKSCKLTPLGMHYWKLVKNERI